MPTAKATPVVVGRLQTEGRGGAARVSAERRLGRAAARKAREPIGGGRTYAPAGHEEEKLPRGVHEGDPPHALPSLLVPEGGRPRLHHPRDQGPREAKDADPRAEDEGHHDGIHPGFFYGRALDKDALSPEADHGHRAPRQPRR